MSALSPGPKEKKPLGMKGVRLVPVLDALLRMISYARRKREKNDKNDPEVDPETNSSNRKTDAAKSASGPCPKTEKPACVKCQKASAKQSCPQKDASCADATGVTHETSTISTSTHQKSTRITR